MLIEYDEKIERITLDFDRDGGLIKAIISRTTYGNPHQLTEVIPENMITKKSFKELYAYILKNWQGR